MAKSFICMSLAFSLLAALGAVLGDQWLGYCETTRYGLGSLEAQCKQRHRKFQLLQTWHFEHTLELFTLLLRLSLLIFGLSLGVALWSTQ